MAAALNTLATVLYSGRRRIRIRTCLGVLLGICITVTVVSNSFSRDLAVTNRLREAPQILQFETETDAATTLTSNRTKPVQELLDGDYPRSSTLKGLVFNGSTPIGGPYLDEFSVEITTSVVKSFSPHVENHVKEIFNDEYGECVFYATLPAMVKRNGGVEIVQRIWLAQYEKMSSYYKINKKNMNEMVQEWKNTWQENFLYSMQLDEDYNLISPGSIMGVPTTTNVGFTYKSDGPMDPRLFTVGDNMYLTFHTWLVDPSYGNQISGRIHMYDMDRHIKKKLTVDIALHRTEINWIPIEVKGELYYTYSLDPLRVMKCNQTTAACKFIYEQKGTLQNPFVYSSDHLRGGTPWIEYKYPYYISLGHNVAVTKKPSKNYSIYNSNIVVMSVDGWRIVYVSENIEYNEKWMSSTPIIRNQTILAPFFYPSGIIMRNPDVLDVSGHLNDAAGYIVRIKGIKKLMEDIIDRDSSNSKQTIAPVRTVQQYVLEGLKLTRKSWDFAGDIIKGSVEKPSFVSM